MGMEVLDIAAWRRRGAYWHTFPSFEQGRKAIWEGFTKEGERVIDFVFPPEQIRSRDNQQMRIELKNGSLYRIIGLDKIETVGAGVVGVLHSEYSIARPKGADMIAPMLRETNGWEAYVFTPRGANHGKKLFDRLKIAAAQNPKRYFCDLKTLRETGAYDYDETIADERARGRPEEIIRQEYDCDWTAANVGAVWGDLVEAQEKAGAVQEFSAAGKRAFTVWDLGGAGAKGDATAFWLFEVRWVAGEVAVDLLGYYESNGKTLEHYFDQVDELCEKAHVEPVRHWLPHDARAKYLTGDSVLEKCYAHWGNDRVAIYPETNLLDGIQAARWLLQRRIRVHPRCNDGWSAIQAYHYKWDEDRKTFSNQPEHDWSSHGSDAFRGLALVVRRSEAMTRPAEPAPKPYVPRHPETVTFDALLAQRERDRRRRR